MTGRAWELVQRAAGPLAALGLVVLLVTVVINWSEATSELRLGWTGTSLALVCVMAGTLLVGQALGALAPSGSQRREFARAYLRAVPAKYLPGGVFQPATQAGMLGGSASAAAVITLAHAALTLAGGCLAALAAAVVFDLALPFWVYPILALPLCLVFRPVLSRGLRLVGRVLRRSGLDGHLPQQHQLLRAQLLTTGGILLLASSFAALVRDPPSGLGGAAAAFCVSWVAGYAVWVLPSGIGAREVVLLGLLQPLPAPSVVGLALAHRVVTALAEAVLATATGWWARSRSGDARGS